jgi:hypothetical protein
VKRIAKLRRSSCSPFSCPRACGSLRFRYVYACFKLWVLACTAANRYALLIVSHTKCTLALEVCSKLSDLPHGMCRRMAIACIERWRISASCTSKAVL